MSRTARQTSSGPLHASDRGDRYGRQRMHARYPAASAAAANGNLVTFSGRGLAGHSGLQ